MSHDDAASVRRAHQAMGPGKEFDTIRMLMQRWGDLAVDIGDDAAVLPVTIAAPAGGERVISVDACVEGAHFLPHWITPFHVGVRAAAAALSDIAAMGARAEAVLLAFVVPDHWRDRLGAVAEGIAEVVGTSGARIIGGNLSHGATFSVTTTVIGYAQQAVARSGAKPGDLLVVTGRLGGPGSAIRAWNSGREPSSWSRTRFQSPSPRLAEGAALAAAGAHAMLDISDGVVADARHLAAASGMRLQIDHSRVPVGDGIDVLEALSSGEEYELLAALPPAAVPALLAEWPGRFAVSLSVIGRVTAVDANGAVDILIDGQLRDAAGTASSRVEFDTGHDHFSRE